MKIINVNALTKLIIWSILFLSFCAKADPTSDRISIGMGRLDVVKVMGSSADSEDCSSTLGIQRCILVWEKGFWTKTSYSVLFIADRVVSVSTQTKRLLGF